MPSRMNVAWPEIALYRILEEFECELLAASDEDIMEAARDLGMNPAMKGSAAFAGVKYPFSRRQMQEFFGVAAWSEEGFWTERLSKLAGFEASRASRQRKQETDK